MAEPAVKWLSSQSGLVQKEMLSSRVQQSSVAASAELHPKILFCDELQIHLSSHASSEVEMAALGRHCPLGLFAKGKARVIFRNLLMFRIPFEGNVSARVTLWTICRLADALLVHALFH